MYPFLSVCIFVFNPVGSLLPAPWQTVLDESSGYHYYWNCETNEVQWEPPPAPAMQYSLPEPPPEPPPQLPTTDVVNKEELGVSKKEAEQQGDVMNCLSSEFIFAVNSSISKANESMPMLSMLRTLCVKHTSNTKCAILSLAVSVPQKK